MEPRVTLMDRAADRAGDLLTDPVLDLLTTLEQETRGPRAELLENRRELARAVRDGAEIELRPDTAGLREDDEWRVAPLPEALRRRQVELATPATAEHAQQALASGADVWVADLEDGLVPSWDRLAGAHRAVGEVIASRAANERPVLMLRPRGVHLEEAHLLLDGAPLSAPVADVGLFLALQARALVEQGSAPFLYLPKVECYEEAQWWDRLLGRAEELLGLPPGTVRVSVLVETVQAIYQLEEIMHALRHRLTALAAGRWDYVFSHLRTYATRPDHVLPDRDSFTMNTRFMRGYTDLVVRTCHRRGAQAIGGPVALVPGGPFDDTTMRASALIRRDKAQEARQGFDGAWVLHPAVVDLAREPFAEVGEERPPRPSGPARVDASTLRDISTLPGSATLTGLRYNLRASLTYLTGWLGGQGTCVIEGHLEDFGTVELARLQVWQWVYHGIRVAEGPVTSALLVDRVLTDEVAILSRTVSDRARVERAAELLRAAVTAEEPPAFLYREAYEVLLRGDGRDADTAA